MVEAANVDATRVGPVDQLQGGRRLVGETQKRQASAVVERDPAEDPVAHGGVEAERPLQVGDAVGGEERPHAVAPAGLGGMFWFRRNTLSGSTASFSAVSRASFAGE